MTSSPTLPVIYLHIGSPKSGTTFIQNVLWANADALRDSGVVLPGLSFSGQQAGVWDLREIRQEETDPAPSWHGAWQTLAAEALVPAVRAAIISHETLAALDERQIERAVRAFGSAEVHVVYTIRDLAGLLPSEWQEYVKHRCVQDYETWLGDVVDGGRQTESGEWFWKVHDAPEVLRRWSMYVPLERIHVVTVPPPGARPDTLWRRIATLMGIDADAMQFGAAPANTSLGQVEIELLRRINRTIPESTPDWLYVSTVKGVLAHQVLARRPDPRKVRLPAARLDWVRERARRLAEGLRAGGYDIVGDLAELLGEPDVQQAVSPVTEAELLAAATDGVLGLLDHVVELNAEIGRLHAERAEAEAKPLHKAVVRHLSDKHQAVMRIRVAYWHLVERLRGPGPHETQDADEERGPRLFGGPAPGSSAGPPGSSR